MKALIVRQSQIEITDRSIQKRLELILTLLRQRKSLKNRKYLSYDELTIIFVSQNKMKQINGQYRHKEGVTDVLSFESFDHPRSETARSIGEIVFCPMVLKKQAKQNNHSLSRELDYLLIHGILHLLGYDHEISIQQEKRMFRIQDRLFTQLTDY
jgi:probable rRNA maturation factor